jgi:hypothetical protein
MDVSSYDYECFSSPWKNFEPIRDRYITLILYCAGYVSLLCLLVFLSVCFGVESLEWWLGVVGYFSALVFLSIYGIRHELRNIGFLKAAVAEVTLLAGESYLQTKKKYTDSLRLIKLRGDCRSVYARELKLLEQDINKKWLNAIEASSLAMAFKDIVNPPLKNPSLDIVAFIES